MIEAELCDWYRWPVETFDSFEELRDKLISADLEAISRRLRTFAQEEMGRAASFWSDWFIRNNLKTYIDHTAGREQV
jgi:hypothetical protein